MSAINQDLKLFRDAFAAHERYKPVWERHERYFRAVHSRSEFNRLKKEKRSTHYKPVIRDLNFLLKNIYSTAFFSRGMPIDITPIGDKDQVKKWAAMKIAKYKWDKFKPYIPLSTAILGAGCFGLGCVRSYLSRGKIITQFVQISDIAFDPAAVDFFDVQFLAYEYPESVRDTVEKFKSGFYKAAARANVLPVDWEKKLFERLNIKEIWYFNQDGSYTCKTYIKDILVRKQRHKRLPFYYGFMYPEMPHIEKERRVDQIMVYGIPAGEFAKDVQVEVNRISSQQDYLREHYVKPRYKVGDKAKMDTSQLRNAGPGDPLRVKGDINQIQKEENNHYLSMYEDIDRLKKDGSASLQINEIMQGQTTPSDRRSMAAITSIHTYSSGGISDGATNLKVSLFERWAKDFVDMALESTTDAEAMRILEMDYNPLKGANLEYDVSVTFEEIDKQMKIQSMIQVLQVAGSNPNINPEKMDQILTKIVDYSVGSEMRIDDLLQENKTAPPTVIPDEELLRRHFANGGI